MAHHLVQSLVPGSEYIEIPGAGHVTHHDNPEATVGVIRRFLAGVGR